MATKKATTAKSHPERVDHVSLARAEYEAFLAREESYQEMLAAQEKTKQINASLTETCDAQARRLTAGAAKTANLERITQLQQVLLIIIRDGTKTASMEDLSEFWRQWLAHTHKGVDAKKFSREDVEKYEPDLFRSWRNWVNDAGKKDRSFSESGSRAAVPGTAKEMQEHIIAHLRQEVAASADRIIWLEAEIEALKKEKRP